VDNGNGSRRRQTKLSGVDRRLGVPEVLRMLGGHARTEQLRERVTRAQLTEAVRREDVVRIGRGRYVLPDLPPARQAAARAHGVLSHATAAQIWGLAQMFPPAEVHISVPPGSRPQPVDGVRHHWCTLPPDEVVDGVTTPLRTVLDCAVTMPFREALAIADSCLRTDLVGEGELLAEAVRRLGPGTIGCRQVAATANGDAANPFESALRAIVLEADLPGFVPQVEIVTAGARARVDLADPELMLVIEGDSFGYHASRASFSRDCRRYDELVRAGWTVLRFTWEQVMFESAWVAAVVTDVRDVLLRGRPGG
jgi:very-short-patch-repair endonuclease